MFPKLCDGGVFDPTYRQQLWASMSVTLIALSHGIGLGWLSPMLSKLQSPSETPIDFTVNIDETSWIGALIGGGGVLGIFFSLLVFDRFGRKVGIYALAIPHICLWILVYFAQSVEYLYLARVSAGLTGGGIYIVLPIFISEISDPFVRGRLTSLFSLSINVGILVGFVLSSFVPYHVIPLIVLPIPILYIIAATYFPETPHFLLRQGRESDALKSFVFYKNLHNDHSPVAQNEVKTQFASLRASVMQQQSKTEKIGFRDFLNRKSLKALGTGIVLMMLNIFCGSLALTNYMSNIFTATKTELHPNVNTIIIGGVQVIGSYTATTLVDSFGRKILMIISTSGMGIGMAAFGMYSFFADETDLDLSAYSYWLPLLLMAIIIFLANVGIISVTYVVLVEIMPPKIRSIASSICLVLSSVFAFTLLRIFPISVQYFGLSAAMWFCATVCAFGLFYITLFLEETKGKAINTAT